MEWLLVVAALACPIGMLAMGAIGWVVAKRAGGGEKGVQEKDAGGEVGAREGALTPDA